MTYKVGDVVKWRYRDNINYIGKIMFKIGAQYLLDMREHNPDFNGHNGNSRSLVLPTNTGWWIADRMIIGMATTKSKINRMLRELT